jgi:hypothetical protein
MEFDQAREEKVGLAGGYFGLLGLLAMCGVKRSKEALGPWCEWFGGLYHF